MKPNDLVSIIVPCFKQAQFLPEALNSILQQTYQEWECFIVSDGSPDHTEDVAKQFCISDNRFVYLKKENGGLSSARNYGLQAAKGNYIQFLDADDVLGVRKLELQLEYLNKNPSVDVVYSSSRYFISDHPETYFPIGKAGQNPTMNLDASDKDQLLPLLWGNCSTICSTLYRINVIEKIGLFDEELKSLEDWDFHVRVGLKGLKFHFEKLPGAECFIRIHPDSMMRDRNKMNTALNLFIEKIKKLVPKEKLEAYNFMELPFFLKDTKEAKRTNKVKYYIKQLLRV